MKSQHLSDEAVAAYADGVLGGIARDRANRHVLECAECRTAVRVQRETASMLRTAPAPPLPSSLADRLRAVPLTTSISTLPTSIGPDGSTLLATFGGAAAFVPPAATAAPAAPAAHHGRKRPTDSPEAAQGNDSSASRHWGKPIVMTAAFVALAGGLTAGSVVHATAVDHTPDPTRTVRSAHLAPMNEPQLVDQIQQIRARRP